MQLDEIFEKSLIKTAHLPKNQHLIATYVLMTPCKPLLLSLGSKREELSSIQRMVRMVTEACVCLGVLDIATVCFLTALIYMEIVAGFLRYLRLSDAFFVVPRAQDGVKMAFRAACAHP